MRIGFSMSIVVLGAMLGGCATITTGTGELVTVETDPKGASCALSTESGPVAVINPTPGSIEAPKSRHDLKVRCEKDGYLPTEGVIASEFAPMTLGNVLIGGVIGVAVDAASGAMTQYAPGVSITLIPKSFPSEEERRRYFDGLRKDLVASHETTLEQIRTECAGKANCDARIAAAEEEHENMLSEIEAKRLRTTIDVG